MFRNIYIGIINDLINIHSTCDTIRCPVLGVYKEDSFPVDVKRFAKMINYNKENIQLNNPPKNKGQDWFQKFEKSYKV